VATGWTALALLWAALVFSLRLRWRRVYWLAVLFPPLWSYVAIFRLDNVARRSSLRRTDPTAVTPV